MGASMTMLTLQKALYRHQQRQLDSYIAGASDAFRAYEATYRRHSRRFRKTLSLSDVHARVADADIVYVGDYHTLRFAQRSFIDLVEVALAQRRRRVVVALEFVEGKHQASVERFLHNELSDEAFLDAIGHPYSGAFDIWPHFRPIFELARRHRLEVVAIDRRSQGRHSLAVRDDYAAKRIAHVAAADDRPLVMVLVGQYHIAEPHLPKRVRLALRNTDRNHVVVFQNPEGAWWRLAESGLLDAEACEFKDGVLGIFNASPLVCQRTFLDYCEAELGDAPVDNTGIASTVRAVASQVARLASIRVTEALSSLKVLTPHDFDAHERLRRSGTLSHPELRHLRRAIVRSESAFIPSANAIWLAGFSLNHAAEEASRFVRHCASGLRLNTERSRIDAFWAGCVEDAIAFFGSKLVNPKRRCTSLETWMNRFSHGEGEPRAIAAFVLALGSLSEDHAMRTGRLFPSRADQTHTVRRALGSLLGEALYEASRRLAWGSREIHELFCTRIDDGAFAYQHWTKISRMRGRGPRRSQTPATYSRALSDFEPTRRAIPRTASGTRVE